jgi:leader peptidase (prepilin peptidase)/N-methyltransferase
VVAAALAGLSLAILGTGAHGVITAAGVAVLVVLTAIDIDRRLVPNRLVLPSAALVLCAQIASEPHRTGEWLIAAFGSAGLLLLVALVNPKGLGMGDVKLALLMGALLGDKVVTAFFLAAVAVLPVAFWILIRRGASARTDTLAFVPFLAFGTVATALFVT